MDYSKGLVKDIVHQFGEPFFVLDSGEEYTVHGLEELSFNDRGGVTFVRVEGMQGDEYLKVEFPLDKIEHHYTHREV